MMMVMMVFSSLSSSSGTYQRYYYCANNTNKNVMLFDTKKGTRRKRKKMRAKSTPKRTKEAHERDEDLGEIVQNRCAKISHKCCCCRGATRHFQKRIYFCTFCALFCELSAAFRAKSRSLSLVKFVPSSSSSSSCSCCSRAIEARKTKREPPPRARARSLRNGIIRKDVQFGTTTTSPTPTFSLCVAEDVDDDVVFYRHKQ